MNIFLNENLVLKVSLPLNDLFKKKPTNRGREKKKLKKKKH